MNIREIEQLQKKGILSKQEVDDLLEGKDIDENGRIMGVFTLNKIYYKYQMSYDLSDEQTNNVYYLREFILKEIYPPLGGESISTTLKTYGYTLCGICDGWSWYRQDTITDYAREKGHKPIEEATMEELWKIIALCSRYWQIFYEREYDNKHKV